MPAARGRWLGAGEVPVGKKVQAKDGSPLWYNGKVHAVSGEGRKITVHIKFDQFNSKHDVRYQYGDVANPPPIRTPLTPLQLRAEHDAHVYGVGPGRDKRGNWLVERVVRVRKKKGQKYEDGGLGEVIQIFIETGYGPSIALSVRENERIESLKVRLGAE